MADLVKPRKEGSATRSVLVLVCLLSWSWSGRSWSAQGGSWSLGLCWSSSLGLPWSWSVGKPTLPAWERGLRHLVCAGPGLPGKARSATRSVPLGLNWSWSAFVPHHKAPLPAWTGPNCSQLAFCASPSSQNTQVQANARLAKKVTESRVAENKFTRSIATCHIGKGVLGMVTMHRILLDSLVGAKVLVPENWWVNASTGKHLKGSKLWKGEIVCIDCTSPGQPLFFFECCDLEDSDGPYPMEVSHFLKFWDRPRGRPRGGALFPRQVDGV